MHNGVPFMGWRGRVFEYLEEALTIVFQYNDLGLGTHFETPLFLKGSIAIWQGSFFATKQCLMILFGPILITQITFIII